MNIAFPPLCPKSRSFSPGIYPTKRFTSISGVGVTRLYGTKPSAANLSLEFLVTDTELQSIFECWHEAKGDHLPVDLPRDVFKGVKKSIFYTSVQWRWGNAPRVESVAKGLSTVKILFISVQDIKLDNAVTL